MYWAELLEKAYKNLKLALEKLCVEIHRVVLMTMLLLIQIRVLQRDSVK